MGVYTQTSPCRRLVSLQHPTFILASSKRGQRLGWDPQRSQSLVLVAPWHLSKLHVGPQTQLWACGWVDLVTTSAIVKYSRKA